MNIQLVDHHMERLLAGANDENLTAVVHVFDFLSDQYPEWIANPTLNDCFQRLMARWNTDKVDVAMALTSDDVADAAYLLYYTSFDVALKVVNVTDLDSLLFADQLRFAALSLAATTLKTERVAKFLRRDLSNLDLLKAVFNEPFEVVTGVRVSCEGLSVDRVFVGWVAELLERAMNQFPVHSILDQSDYRRTSVRSLKFALMAALARYAILSCQRRLPA